jgi:hypothetical protein
LDWIYAVCGPAKQKKQAVSGRGLFSKAR